MRVLILLVSLFATTLHAETAKIEDSIKKLNWNGIDVVFIEDNRFPTYDMLLYFADGALSDDPAFKGITSHAFSLLDSGTARMTQAEIMDQFEFLGTELNTEVTHEYTTLSMSGLAKDMSTSVTFACNLLREANFPKPTIKQELDKERSYLASLIANPQGLSDRVFREVSLNNTPYSYPVNGKLKDLEKYTPELLRSKVDTFLDKVKKRIYLTGPKSTLSIEKILVDKCKLKGSPGDTVRSINYKKVNKFEAEIVFVPVPDANQVQVKIGRFLNFDEIGERPLDTLASEFLGGGFTSRLMREVRVKRGLTYSIGSYISSQKQYGRAGISTFTKNETVNKLIDVISEAILKIQQVGISDSDLEDARSGIIGAQPFKFESNRAFLSQLLYLDHVERPYSELFDFNAAVLKYDSKAVAKKIETIYGMKSQIIFVLGDKSIEKELRKLKTQMRILDYKKFI